MAGLNCPATSRFVAPTAANVIPVQIRVPAAEPPRIPAGSTDYYSPEQENGQFYLLLTLDELGRRNT
jgi:hypothetical protein